jgi:hypothetical protein
MDMQLRELRDCDAPASGPSEFSIHSQVISDLLCFNDHLTSLTLSLTDAIRTLRAFVEARIQLAKSGFSVGLAFL